MRILLEYLLPLLLPALIWLGYGRVERRRAAGGSLPWWASVPWLLVALALVTAAGIALSWFALSGGAGISARYQPPHLEDGRLVPGRFVEPGR